MGDESGGGEAAGEAGERSTAVAEAGAEGEYTASHEGAALENLVDDADGEGKTIHGAVVILSHEYEDGTVEYLFEQKAGGEYDGLLSLIGGHINSSDKDQYAAIVREVEEEFHHRGAKHRILTALGNKRTAYTVMTADVGGQSAYTYVYDVQIETDESWELIKHSGLNEGAVDIVITLDDMLHHRYHFAFDQGGMLLDHAKMFYLAPKYNGFTNGTSSEDQTAYLSVAGDSTAKFPYTNGTSTK